jgi:ribosomal protein L29
MRKNISRILTILSEKKWIIIKQRKKKYYKES